VRLSWLGGVWPRVVWLRFAGRRALGTVGRNAHAFRYDEI